jgi:hypothetical protein
MSGWSGWYHTVRYIIDTIVCVLYHTHHNIIVSRKRIQDVLGGGFLGAWCLFDGLVGV